MFFATCFFAAPCRAQVDYVARFRMEKNHCLLGEPVFCVFSIQNTGKETFAFRYRSPSRVLNPELESEPRFQVTTAQGRRVADPAPEPCGGAPGTVVYGSVTLPPGQTHTERWLLDQWGRFTAPGEYHVRAERRLPLLGLDPRTQEFTEKPLAFALALNELTFEIAPAREAQLRPLFAPYLAALKNPAGGDSAEAAVVVTTLPHTFLLPELEAMAGAPAHAGWDRKQALEGLARLGTRAAWRAVLNIAQGRNGNPGEDLRAYAVLLLAEKGDPAFLPPLLKLAAASPVSLRGDVLRALGFFRDPRAYRTIFERLHSTNVTDRMNAILGLKISPHGRVFPPCSPCSTIPKPRCGKSPTSRWPASRARSVRCPRNPRAPTSHASARSGTPGGRWRAPRLRHSRPAPAMIGRRRTRVLEFHAVLP